MDTTGLNLLFGILAFALLGAAFSAVDGALTALGEFRLKAIIEEQNKLKNAALRVLEKRKLIHIRYLTGRVLCIVGMATFTAYAIQPLAKYWLSLSAIAGVSLFYAATAETITSIIKRRGIFLALRMTQWLRPIEIILTPFSIPIFWLNRLIERFVPEKRTRPLEDITDLAVEHVIEESEERGAIPEDQAELLRSVLEFRNTVAREVMVPRTQMIAIDISTPLEQVLSIMMDSGHSRYPLFKDRVDQIEGATQDGSGGTGGDPENPMGAGGTGGDLENPAGGTGGDLENPAGAGGDAPMIPVGGEGGSDYESGPNCADIQDPIEQCFLACEWIITCLEEGPICIRYDRSSENDIRTQCREYCVANAEMSTFGGTICGPQNQQCKIVLPISGVDSIGLNSVGESCTDPQEFINSSCTPCHIDGAQRNGLNLDNILGVVGQASTAGIAQITAGDHANSYVWRKMDGTQEEVNGGGVRMPFGGSVSQEDLDAFANWIDSL